jgi:hypothetical protein
MSFILLLEKSNFNSIRLIIFTKEFYKDFISPIELSENDNSSFSILIRALREFNNLSTVVSLFYDNDKLIFFKNYEYMKIFYSKLSKLIK